MTRSGSRKGPQALAHRGLPLYGMSMILAGLVFSLLGAGFLQAGDDAPPAQDVWGCVYSDPQQNREPTPLMFIGSSSIARWDNLARDVGANAVRCGYWGKQTSDMIPLAQTLAGHYRPRRIFYYAGDNDLDDDHGRHAPSNTPEGVRENFARFVANVRMVPGMADTPVSFLSIKECPDRWHLIESIRQANLAVCRFAEKDPNLDFIDVFDALLTDDHTAPNANLFAADGLHLNEAGYKRWGGIIRRWTSPGERFVTAHGCKWLEYVAGKTANQK